jgi:hypothetical protein
MAGRKQSRPELYRQAAPHRIAYIGKVIKGAVMEKKIFCPSIKDIQETHTCLIYFGEPNVEIFLSRK